MERTFESYFTQPHKIHSVTPSNHPFCKIFKIFGSRHIPFESEVPPRYHHSGIVSLNRSVRQVTINSGNFDCFHLTLNQISEGSSAQLIMEIRLKIPCWRNLSKESFSSPTNGRSSWPRYNKVHKLLAVSTDFHIQLRFSFLLWVPSLSLGQPITKTRFPTFFLLILFLLGNESPHEMTSPFQSQLRMAHKHKYRQVLGYTLVERG